MADTLTVENGPAEAGETVSSRGFEALEATSGAFFRRIDWSAFLCAFLASLVSYMLTLAPTVTLEDSGELVVASDYIGVPHPPGYPIWSLATWFFQWVFDFVTYNGHPNPAWAVGLASAVFGALACGILAMLICRSGADLLRSVPRFNQVMGYRTESLFCWAAGVSAAMVFAYTPVMWSQSVIVEVYSLNAFFQVLVLLLLYRWMMRPKDRTSLYWMAFIFGLGLTNHQTLLLMGVALAVCILVRDVRLFMDFAIAGLPLAAILGLNILASKYNLHQSLGVSTLKWIDGPEFAAFWIQTALFVLIPIAMAFILPNGRTVCYTILLVELGVAFYLYLPFSSEQNPPINWGYPRTWQGFIHAVSRGQYEQIKPANIFTLTFLKQVMTFLRDLKSQFTFALALPALLPFCAWRIRLPGLDLKGFTLASLMGVLVLLLVGAAELFFPEGSRPMAVLYKAAALPVAVILFCAVVGFVLVSIRFVVNLWRTYGDPETGWLARLGIGLILALALAVATFVAYEILKHVRQPGLRPAQILQIVAGVLLPVAGVAAVAWMMRKPLELRFETDDLSQGWLLTTVAAFVAVSIGFVMLANPELDIQTLFIQRVQYIQSHAVYVIWIGFGVLFGLTALDLLFRGSKVVRIPAVAIALALPVIPWWQNYYDAEQIRVLGGAEQNGHSFGWQFGNWQLRGVNGIEEDLKAWLPPAEFEKEWAAYPDKTYPPEMSSNAVFYGGTDPGRFVPTYMIYCAKVRPDVFLITQNALADGTYLNVMRDLYGDQIMIPSAHDSNMAFQEYLDRVSSGQMDAGADVQMKDGRVSVQGAAGVMQINGILAKQIFDANKYQHEFYVEESYVIPWMYPYLTPHGLIMKINREPTALTPAIVKQDHDFWTWYCKRLLGDSKFTRDVCARKTFSKLRGSIANLYLDRRMFDEAEYALKQAVDLYPLSPEAHFRLSDLYMQMQRYDDAIKQIEGFLKQDPGNRRVGDLLAHIKRVTAAQNRRMELERIVGGGAATIEQELELAQLYAMLGAIGPFQQRMDALVAHPQLKAEHMLGLAEQFFNAKRFDLVEVVMQRYLMRAPQDWNAWAALAIVQFQRQKPKEALATVARAVQLGGEAARNVFRNDPRFAPMRNFPEFNQLVPPPAQAPINVPNNIRDMLR